MPVVYSAANPTEAHLCRQFLENEGIDARVMGRSCGRHEAIFLLTSQQTRP